MSSGPDFVEIANAIASVINFEADPIGFPWSIPWPHKFRVIEPAIGAKIIVRESDDQEISEVPADHVAHCIVSWLRLQKDKDSLVTFRKAREVVEMWLCFAEPIRQADIKSVRWKSELGYTWRRLPWDKATGDTPTWDKIFGKLTNAGSFRQWLGSLLYEEAKQHQYVWVHGMGNDGKGCINRFLEAVFGKSYRSKQPPAQGDKFWTYGLLGSRLVVFPDCNSQTYTTGGAFKSLSGGDPVDVEAKGRMSFTTRLNCKFLFFSNEKPNISCEDADMRRIIYCEFFEKTKDEDKDPDFETKMWDEGGHFLSRCVAEYLEACPRHQNIQSDKDDIQTWVSVGEERFQAFFDSLFMIPIEQYRNTRLLGPLTDEQLNLITVRPEDMLACLSAAFPDRKDQMQFRDWMYKKYNVQKKSIRRAGTVVYRYVGVGRQPTGKAAERMRSDLALFYRDLKVLSTPSTVDTLSM